MQRPSAFVLLALAMIAPMGCDKPSFSRSARAPASESPPPPRMKGRVAWVTCTNDGKTLAYGNDKNRVYVLDVATGKERSVLEGHTGFVSHVEFAPDGKILASGGDDNTIRLWDVATAKELATLRAIPTRFEVSPSRLTARH